MEDSGDTSTDRLEEMLKHAKWKVMLSDNFKNAFGKLISSSTVKNAIMHILLTIASGMRPNRLVDLPCKSSLQSVKKYEVDDYSVVYTIDIMKEFCYVQVLKVWDILPSKEVPKLLVRLDSIFAIYTDDFIKRCKERSIEKCLGGYLDVPKSWEISHNIIRYKIANNKSSQNFAENCNVSESLLLMRFYTLSTPVVNHLLSDYDCTKLDLPFEVTDEERDIILFRKSCFILGRSGTGKTTVLTMKLYRNIEELSFASNGLSQGGEFEGNILRQLFITVSPKLCYVVKQHMARLKRFADGGQHYTDKSSIHMDDIDDMAQFEDIPDSFVGIQPDKYPLVITFRKFLMMLDGSVGNSYFDRFNVVRELPLDNTSSGLVSVQRFINTKEVNYDHFCCFYWPHFNEKLIKNLDPSRVFAEIMSYIKGGLSKKEYVSLAKQQVSTLDKRERGNIYDIFLAYEKIKKGRGEFDLADFVTDVHFRLKNQGLQGDMMDFVYIDEVQDLTMSQISLLRYICNNVDEGFVFSGDTAQTIAKGVDFRFEDVRSLFYRDFFMKSKESQLLPTREKKGCISDILKLSQNFRSHSGVLRLGQRVIDILSYFFPQSIDALAPETSLVFGEPPVILDSGSDDNALLTIFGGSESVDKKIVGFGAQQVILVRDDFTKKEISNYIGHHALILTIVECKGLEFQDVLLYNFFGSSPLKKQWRVINDFLKGKGLLDSGSPMSSPNFSHPRHRIMCHELKQLYVAITRTRQRLWICENTKENSKPVFDYWKSLGLVNVRKVDDSLAQAMKKASTPEEWKSQGIKLYGEKYYEMAIMCFERAGEPEWEKRAKAAGLKAAADRLRGSKSIEASKMLREAAELFDSIGKTDLAAECLRDLKENEKAGSIDVSLQALKDIFDCLQLKYENEEDQSDRTKSRMTASLGKRRTISRDWPWKTSSSESDESIEDAVEEPSVQRELENLANRLFFEEEEPELSSEDTAKGFMELNLKGISAFSDKNVASFDKEISSTESTQDNTAVAKQSKPEEGTECSRGKGKGKKKKRGRGRGGDGRGRKK